jgi:hypothetical protein
MNCQKPAKVCACAKTYFHNSFNFVSLICEHIVWWERNFETEGDEQNIEQ